MEQASAGTPGGAGASARQVGLNDTGAGSRTLAIKDFEVKDDIQGLCVRAVLIDRITNQVLKETPFIAYRGLSIDRVEFVPIVQNQEQDAPLIAGLPAIMRVLVRQRGALNDVSTSPASPAAIPDLRRRRQRRSSSPRARSRASRFNSAPPPPERRPDRRSWRATIRRGPRLAWRSRAAASVQRRLPSACKSATLHHRHARQFPDPRGAGVGRPIYRLPGASCFFFSRRRIMPVSVARKRVSPSGEARNTCPAEAR